MDNGNMDNGRVDLDSNSKSRVCHYFSTSMFLTYIFSFTITTNSQCINLNVQFKNSLGVNAFKLVKAKITAG